VGQEQFLIDVGRICILVNFWACLLFFVVLPTFWLWWKAPLGRALAAIEFLLLVAFTPPALSLMFGLNDTGLPYQWLTVLVLAAIPLRLMALLGTLFWIQMHANGQNPTLREALTAYFLGLPALITAPWQRAWRRVSRFSRPV
jgi:hypothetical protein